jgi:hypothetical protein
VLGYSLLAPGGRLFFGILQNTIIQQGKTNEPLRMFYIPYFILNDHTGRTIACQNCDGVN